MTADIDLIIAVHDERRPVDRAVASALESTNVPVRVTLVAHGISPDRIAARLGKWRQDKRVRIMAHNDGIRSAAGPFNAGLDAADASFVSVMGSDDTLEPHALESWLHCAEKRGADVVIARLKHAGGAAVPTPPTRPRRTILLDGVRDRLSYRSAPLGLVSRARFPRLRFAESVPTGEDIPFVTALWFSGSQIAYDRRGPAYLIHNDADQRTTFTRRPLADEFLWVDALMGGGVFDKLSPSQRQAVVIKCLRIHLFGAIFHRAEPACWGPRERASLSQTAHLLVNAGEGIHEVLSRRDRRLLDLALDPGSPTSELLAAAEARRRFLHPGSLLPRRLRYTAHREAPIRFAAASALQLR